MKEYEILLIGDTGNPELKKPDPVLTALYNDFSNNSIDTICVLGDIIYPNGMPSIASKGRQHAENVMKTQLDTFKQFNNKLIFISGNHDWNKGKKNGFEYAMRQEVFIQEYLNRKDVCLPPGGCPGPVFLEENELVNLIVINSQWWMQTGFRPVGSAHHCTVKDENNFFKSLHDFLEKNKSKVNIILSHLPIYSYSTHGGKYKLKHHIFPFSIYNKKGKYVPIPLLGSLLPLYRMFIGAKEDISFPRYRNFRNKLKKVILHFPGTIYCAGHEHNLQYIRKAGIHYLISGAGSKVNYVKPGTYTKFAKASKGYMKIHINEEGKVRLKVITVNRTASKQVVYDEEIIRPKKNGGQ